MPGYQHTQVPALQRVSARILQAAFLVALSGLPAQAQGGLEFARQLYNQGRYDQAITAASRLRPTTVADAANLVLGRSYLERFRKTTDHADLVAAREALNQIHTAQLASRDRIDYLVGLDESLYLGESYGPAAELFQGALERSQDMGPLSLIHI